MSLQVFFMKDIFKDIIICPFCGVPTKMVWIHGHGQCAYCKNVIDECCRGEHADPQSKNEQDENSEIKEDKKNENKP